MGASCRTTLVLLPALRRYTKHPKVASGQHLGAKDLRETTIAGPFSLWAIVSAAFRGDVHQLVSSHSQYDLKTHLVVGQFLFGRVQDKRRRAVHDLERAPAT
jgi:hypothetical protein